MKILFLEPYPILPPDRGSKHHVLGLLRYLAPRHDVSIFGLDEPGRDRSWQDLQALLPVRVLSTYPRRSGLRLRAEQARLILKGQPWALAHLSSSALARRVRQIEPGEYDVVVADMFQMAPYGLACPAARVLIGTDAYSLALFRAARAVRSPALRLKLFASAVFQLRYEYQTYPGFDVVTCVSPVDNFWLEGLNGAIRTRLVEIAVDTDLLARARPINPARRQVLIWALADDECAANDIIGFIEHGWPLVHERVPDAELIVWGRRPTPRLRQAMARAVGVRHLGYVDDWVAQLLQADVFLHPLRSSTGIQTKIQSAMALSTPLVLSPEANGGLRLTEGSECVVARTPQEYAAGCIALLTDPSSRMHVGARMREVARARFTPAVTGAAFEAVLEEAVEHHRASARSIPSSRVGSRTSTDAVEAR